MTLDWRKLPLEVWLNIFHHVDSSADLIQCRMACKCWDPLAEKSIFNRNLVIWSEKSSVGLYQHLLRKPRLGKFIKSLQMKRTYFTSKMINLKKLLLLVLNEEFEYLDWYCTLQDKIPSMLLEIIEKAPEKHKKLRRIADPSTFGVNETYPQLIYALRNSLEHIQINRNERNRPLIANVYNRLNEFKSLKSIAFENLPFDGLTALDGRLQELQQLQTLKLGFDHTTPVDYEEKDATEMNKWLQENVQQSGAPKDIYLEPSFRKEGITANLVDYVTYKFTNLKKLSLSGVPINNLDRFMPTIESLPCVSLDNCIFDKADDHQKLARVMRGEISNDIELRYQSKLSEPKFSMQKDAITGSGLIHIDLDRDLSHKTFQDVLSTIGTAGVSRLIIDLFNDRNWTMTHEARYLMAFDEVLMKVPQVEYFWFQDAYIHYQHFDPGELVLPNLHTLLLWGAKINSRVLSTISRVSPKLHTLRLISCLVHSNDKIDQDAKFDQKTTIHMPSTSFTALFLLTSNISYLAPKPPEEQGESSDDESDNSLDSYENNRALKYMHYTSIHSLIKVVGVAFLRLSCADFKHQEQCYMLFSKAPPMLISKEELVLYSAKRQLFDIECKTITSLNIEIEDFVVHLKFSKDGDLEGATKSPMKLLEEQNKALIEKQDTLKKQEADIEEKLAASQSEAIQLTEKYLNAEKKYIEAEKRYIASEKKNLELQREIMMSRAQHSSPDQRS